MAASTWWDSLDESEREIHRQKKRDDSRAYWRQRTELTRLARERAAEPQAMLDASTPSQERDAMLVSVGASVRTIRAKRMSQIDFADEMGWQPFEVDVMERGKRWHLTSAEIAKMAEVLGVEPDALTRRGGSSTKGDVALSTSYELGRY